jgi:hypothetical protein
MSVRVVGNVGFVGIVIVILTDVIFLVKSVFLLAYVITLGVGKTIVGQIVEGRRSVDNAGIHVFAFRVSETWHYAEEL